MQACSTFFIMFLFTYEYYKRKNGWDGQELHLIKCIAKIFLFKISCGVNRFFLCPRVWKHYISNIVSVQKQSLTRNILFRFVVTKYRLSCKTTLCAIHNVHYCIREHTWNYLLYEHTYIHVICSTVRIINRYTTLKCV